MRRIKTHGYILLGLVVIIAFLLVLLWPKSVGENLVVEMAPSRIDYVEVQNMPNYGLSSPKKVKLEFLPDKFKEMEFTIYQYLPTYIEYRKYFKTPPDMKLQSPEDALLASASFTLRYPMNVSYVYEESVDDFLKIGERSKKSIKKYRLSYEKMVNLKTYTRLWYKIEFQYKGKDCCILIYDSSNNPNSKLKYMTLIKTPDGWKYVFSVWIEMELIDTIRHKIKKYLATNFPFQNSPYDPDSRVPLL